MTVRKDDGHYELISHKGKVLARGSKKKVLKRERQIEYFKHHPEARRSAHGSGTFTEDEIRQGYRRV